MQASARPKSQSVPLSGLSRLGCVPRCGQRVKLSSLRRVQTDESCGFGSGLDVRLAAHSHYLRCGVPLRSLLLCAENCRVHTASSPQAAYLYFGLGWSVLTEHWNRWLRNTIFSTTYNPIIIIRSYSHSPDSNAGSHSDCNTCHAQHARMQHARAQRIGRALEPLCRGRRRKGCTFARSHAQAQPSR